MQINVKNVNVALATGINHMLEKGVRQESRNGPTLEIPEPVVTTYLKPTERVLFNSTRDCNPFFHYMESLWMFAGRNDTAFLTQFVKTMIDFSDDGLIFNAGYGYRIREHFGFDQFNSVVEMLKKDKDSRQAVIQIWDHQDLNKQTKDKACNTSIMFKVRDGKLNMTVTNRSNDMVWGAYGANAVHFSMMQEYVAAAVGVDVGVYNQISDSLHVYVNNPKWQPLVDELSHDIFEGRLWIRDPYEDPKNTPHKLVDVPDVFLQECEEFCENPERIPTGYLNNTFKQVAHPMFVAYKMHKNGDTLGAINLIDNYMVNCDWKTACKEWLQRRIKV